MQRQYTGTAGRIENAQVGVFLGYAGRHGHALIDRALLLPKSWTDDRARCRAAHVPDDVTFATKPALGLAMLERARGSGLPFAWVAGDSVYGGERAIRRWAEDDRIGYVLTVTSGRHESRADVFLPFHLMLHATIGHEPGDRLRPWCSLVPGRDAGRH